MKRNRYKILLATVILALASVFVYTSSDNVYAKTRISKKNLTMKVSEKSVLKLKGAKGKIVWKSNKPKIVKVSKKGKVTALKQGRATITAKNKGKKYICKVKVEMNNNTQYFFITDPTPIPLPTPTPEGGIAYEYYNPFMAINQFFDYVVEDIEDGFITIKATDSSETANGMEYKDKERARLSVADGVKVISNEKGLKDATTKIVSGERFPTIGVDIEKVHFEGIDMNYSDIKTGDLVDIIYLYNSTPNATGKFETGVKVINVKR